MKAKILQFAFAVLAMMTAQAVQAQTYDYYPVGSEFVDDEECPISDPRTYRMVFDGNGLTFSIIDSDGMAKWPRRFELVRNDNAGRVYQVRSSSGCVETLSFTQDLSQMYKNYTCPLGTPTSVSRNYRRK